MKFIDTHAHWFLPEFDIDRKNALEDALQNNIEKVILPNVDKSTILPLIETANLFPGRLHKAIGLHPSSVDQNWKDELNFLYEYLINEKDYCAIGEIGIDLYWDKSKLELQKIAFREQLNWAKKHDLPVIIHSRSSLNEVFSILSEFKDITGVFHCFPGSIEQAKIAIKKGFFIGIGGVVTYNNSGMQKVVKEIPLEWILLETDAPYLTPVPHRGKRNTSKYIIHIAEKIAEIKEIELTVVAKVTTENAKKLFKL